MKPFGNLKKIFNFIKFIYFFNWFINLYSLTNLKKIPDISKPYYSDSVIISNDFDPVFGF